MTITDTPAELTGDVASPIEHRFERCGNELTHVIEVTGTVHRSTVRYPAGYEHETDASAWWRAYLAGARPEPAVSRGALSTVELFCGPGGLALGFGQAASELGYEMHSAAAVDQDAEALAIYRRHNATRHAPAVSVSTIVDYRVRGQGETARFRYDPEMLRPELADLAGKVDVVLAGPPCQGHSNLNNRTRRDDKRNELYLTAPATAVALGARMVIIENVHAVIHDRKQVVQSTIQLLRDAGYEVTSEVIKAAQMGWPQRRDRYFVVARRDAAPLAINDVKAAFAAEQQPVWWAIGDLETAPEDDLMNMRPALSEENQRRIDWLFDNDEHDLGLAQRPDCHKDGTTYNSVYGRLHADRPAPTITTGFLTPGRGRYIHPTQRRVLTPREAARLQGFPDTYDFRLPGAERPKTWKLAKWIGDAVPMPLGYLAGISAIGGGDVIRP